MAFSRWSLLLERVRNRLQEPSEAFYKTDRMRDFGKQGQVDICSEIEPLEHLYTFESVADTKDYSLPPDVIRVLNVTWDDWRQSGRDISFRDTMVKTYPSGTPSEWVMKDEDTLRLYAAPGSAETANVYYKRRTPLGAIHITRDTSGSITDATFQAQRTTGAMTATQLDLVETGGSTFNIDLTAAAYDTLTELVTYINTLSGWTVVLDDTCNGADNSNLLEVTAEVVSCYNAQKIIDEDIEVKPQLRELMEFYIMWQALDSDTEYEEGRFYRDKYYAGLESQRRKYWKKRPAKRVKDVYRETQGGMIQSGGYMRIFVP